MVSESVAGAAVQRDLFCFMEKVLNKMVLPIFKKVLPDQGESMSHKKYFTTIDIALISIFSTLWIALNYFAAPISFQLLHLPVGHGILVFFVLLLVAWATGKAGAAVAVAVIGSIVVLLAGGPLPVISFAAASTLFDATLTACHHKLKTKPYNMGIAVLATLISAYVAGVITGVFILNQGLWFALTVWAGWTLLGGILGAAITLPIIGALEKANVKKIKSS
jgi:MFS family permease